jgi:hypothetical protein
LNFRDSNCRRSITDRHRRSEVRSPAGASAASQGRHASPVYSGLFTGQRKETVLNMMRPKSDASEIQVYAQKIKSWIPTQIHSEYRQIIDAVPVDPDKSQLKLHLMANGQPWTYEGWTPQLFIASEGTHRLPSWSMRITTRPFLTKFRAAASISAREYCRWVLFLDIPYVLFRALRRTDVV